MIPLDFYPSKCHILLAQGNYHDRLNGAKSV